MAGLRVALRRWPVAGVLLLANLATGLAFMAATWLWLSIALDDSLASRTLLTDLNLNIFIDLLAHHGGSLQMLAVGGVLLGSTFLLFAVWLNGVAIVAVAEDGSVGDCAHRSLRLYPLFFRLALIATVANAASVGGGYLVGRALARRVAESPVEMTFYWAVSVGVLVGGLLLLFFTTVHDHARVNSAATGAGALRSYGWALAFVGRRQWRCLPLTLLLFATAIFLWGIYQSVAGLVPATSPTGVPLSLAWGELFMFARMVHHLWRFGAVTELQILSE